MSMIKEFKDFAMKGNLVDIAVGFVMGAAFKEVVSSFTGGIVSPLIGLIFNADFKDLKYVVVEGVANAEGVINVIDFVIVAFVMFMIVKAVNAMKKKEEEAPATPKGPSQEELLGEIRDLLKK